MDLSYAEFDYFYKKLWDELVLRNFSDIPFYKRKKYGQSIWTRSRRDGGRVGELFVHGGQRNRLYFYNKRLDFENALDKRIKQDLDDKSYLKALVYLRYGLLVDPSYSFDAIERDERWPDLLEDIELVQELHERLIDDFNASRVMSPPMQPYFRPNNAVDMPLPYENFNCFVFGKIEIPSISIACSYSDPYRQEDVEICYTNEFFESRSDYPIELETAKDDLLQYTKKTFSITRYNPTPMVRIDDIEHEPEDENDRRGSLILHLSNTTYDRFLATNKALEAEIEPGVSLRQKYGSGPYHDFAESVLSNAVGLECIVISDNPNQHPQRQVIIRKRAAKNVNSYRGFYQGSAGGFMSTAHVDKTGKPSPFVTASEETKQEVSSLLTGVEPDDFRMLGLTTQWHLLQPIFLGYFVTHRLAREILGDPRRDAYEGQVHAIPFTAESVINHIAENEWVPNSALAMIFTLLAEFPADEVTAVAENLPKSKKAEDFRAN